MSNAYPTPSVLPAAGPGPEEAYDAHHREHHRGLTIRIVVSTVLAVLAILTRVIWSHLPWTPLAISLTLLGRNYYETLRWRASGTGIVCYSHSSLLYYWNIWLYAFIAADLTMFLGSEVILPSGASTLMVATSSLGVGFVFVLAFTIFIANVHLRGVGAILFGFLIAFVMVILHHFRLLGNLLDFSLSRSVFISREGFLTIGVATFLPWLVTIFFFDLRRWVKVTTNMITLVKEIGEGEVSMETTGVTISHLRDNWIQHRLLGFGSGDLVIEASQHSHAIHIPNVFNVHYVTTQIHRVMEDRMRR